MITSPEPDTYGQYARASLIADYVELLALKHPVRRGIVEDFFADNHWNLELLQPSEGDFSHYPRETLEGRLDEAHDLASIVFGQIEERCRLLSRRYPFAITEGLVSLKPDLDRESCPYVAMLSLTVAHAFNVGLSHKPEELFEHIVTKILNDRGLLSAGVATLRRSRGSFEKALCAACNQVGLKSVPNAAPRYEKGHDEGVDVLSHMSWEEDPRSSAWVFIGQATVGRSDIWSKKINEPNPGRWAQFICIRNRPLPFLAVPHHVERQMMEKLAFDGVVLDRIRLVRFKNENDREEREIIRAVAQECVEPLSG